MEQKSNQMKRVIRSRVALLLDHPFFGNLCLKLRLIEDAKLPTFATDGTCILFNPEFAEKLSDEEVVGVLAHETLHAAFLHVFRLAGRHPVKWNVACDFAINLLLTQAGFKLPGKPMTWEEMAAAGEAARKSGAQPESGHLLDPAYEGMSADAIYAKLPIQVIKINMAGQGTGEFTEGGKGTATDENGNPVELDETSWKIAVEQAAQCAKKAGNLPGGLEALVKANTESKTDWKAILREFLVAQFSTDVSWMRPNRRFVGAGIYLPGAIKEDGTGRLLLAVDTSGSITDKMLGKVAAEISSIVNEVKPEEVMVAYWDTRIAGVESFFDGDEIVLHAKGRGGTAAQPVTKFVNDLPEKPLAVIYVSDLQLGDSPKAPDGVPCIWVVPDSCSVEPPFGSLVKIDDLDD